jgi:hypothetical protein
MTTAPDPKPSPQEQQQLPAPSWANLFDEIMFTPEEDGALDAAWASPEVQAAVKKTPPKEEDIPPA